MPGKGSSEQYDDRAAEHRAAGLLHKAQASQRCPLGSLSSAEQHWLHLQSSLKQDHQRLQAEWKCVQQDSLLSLGASPRHPACGLEHWKGYSRKAGTWLQTSLQSLELPARSLVRVLWAEFEPRLLAGVGLYYGEEIHGVPPVLLQMLPHLQALLQDCQ